MDYENRWNYSLVAELQKTLSEKNERIIQLENMWDELKDYLLRFENIPVQVQSFKTVFELMKEIERIEKENER